MYKWHIKDLRCVIFLFTSLLIANVSIAAPPNCANAVANPDTLWPPNNKFARVAINGVTDPDGDATTIAITCIRQDEPLSSIEGDAKGVGEPVAQVRRDRIGNLNGRFYHISFTATDTNGESCTGEVSVSVARSPSKQAIDDGPLFQSTLNGVCGVEPNINPIITSAPVTTAQVGTPYRYDVEASDIDGDVLSFILLIAPAGMVIDSVTGLITWLPTAADVGSVPVKVLVDDGNGGSSEQSFTITVTAPVVGPVVRPLHRH